MPLNDSKIADRSDVLIETNDATAGIGGAPRAGETLDRVGSAASEFNDANLVNDNLGTARGELDDIDADDDSPVKWIMPLVLLALLVALGSLFCGKS